MVPEVGNDEQEDALILEPGDAVDHRTQRDPVRAGGPWRTDAERERRRATRRDGRLGLRRGTIRRKPVHGHAERGERSVVAVDPQIRL